jgi:AcrR family transcriptional regulator
LAAILVEAMATRIIRTKPASLDAKTQNDLLREKASEIVRRWNFPECRRVQRLVDGIAARCLEVSLEPNAWLGAGANAFGILQDDFQAIPTQRPELARVIQFGLAYNAFTLVPQYPCKGKTWCLVELAGLPALKHGLTLKRGGFVEGDVDDLVSMLKEM